MTTFSNSAMAVLACAATTMGSAQTISLQGAGATFPLSPLLQVDGRVSEAPPQRPDQLPVHRFRRRHQADPGKDRRLRSHRRGDDRPGAGQGHLHPPPHPHDPRRRGRHLSVPGVATGLKLSQEVLANIFLGRITVHLERPQTGLPESRRQTARHPHHRGLPFQASGGLAPPLLLDAEGRDLGEARRFDARNPRGRIAADPDGGG